MKNIKNIFALLVVALIGLSLTACSEDDLSTNQYKDGVSLNAYGPNPVMRGGTLRFVGSNLDQIASIQIPGVAAITNYETIKTGVPSEIRVTVPKDGPTVGYITLTTKTDETITTRSELTYTEPIEFESFSPASAMPGEVVTIKGDYLNLIYSLAFADGVVVGQSDFLSHDRYSITVAVPEKAQTGKIELYTADLTVSSEEELDYQIITSENAIEIGVPAIATLAGRNSAEALGNITAKAGETITVTGTYFNVVAGVKVGGTAVDEITIAEDNKALSFTLPAAAPSGDIELICKSGVVVPVGTLTTVKPGNGVAAPSPVKALTALTVSGTDMDLVTAVTFLNSGGNPVEGSEIEATADKVVITSVPDVAVEGNLLLVMANGETVEVAFTLVKPTVTGYDNTTVSAGGALTIQGTDLDLVKTVQFGDGSDMVNVENATAETITLSVPMNAVSGAPTLTLANGTTVDNVPSVNIEEAVFCYASALPGDDAELKAGESLTLTVANGDKLTGVEIDGTACQYVLVKNNTELIVGVPDNAGSGSKVRLISSNGEITYTIDFIPNSEKTTVLWTGAVDLASWSFNWEIGKGSNGDSNPNMFADMGLEEGDVIRVYVTPYNDWWNVKIYDGHWGEQTEAGVAAGIGSGCEINSGNYSLDEHGGCIEFTATATLVSQLTTLNDWGMCWIMMGEGAVITKIAVTHYISLEQDLKNCIVRQDDRNVLFPYPIAMSWDDAGRFCIMIDRDPAIKDMKLVAGKSAMYFYTSGTGQLQINNPNWGAMTTVAEWSDAGDKKMELILTDDIINCLKGVTSDGWSSTGLIIQGDGMTVSKITILP
jgi:hypothetical protein